MLNLSQRSPLSGLYDASYACTRERGEFSTRGSSLQFTDRHQSNATRSRWLRRSRPRPRLVAAAA